MTKNCKEILKPHEIKFLSFDFLAYDRREAAACIAVYDRDFQKRYTVNAKEIPGLIEKYGQHEEFTKAQDFYDKMESRRIQLEGLCS